MPLDRACVASLLLHAALLAIPAGSLAGKAGVESAGSPPRLSVSLLRVSPRRSDDAPQAALRAAAPAQQPDVPVPALGIPGPRYYEPRELTRRAKAIGDIAPLVPGLNDGEESGRLVLVLRIADTGRVDAVDIEQTTVGETLAQALVARFGALRFHPAELDGSAVASRMKIEVLLRPPGA